MGSLVKMLNFREGSGLSRSHSWRMGWIGTLAWMIPKPVFFQETSPFAQPHPCSLQEKSKARHQCRAQTFQSGSVPALPASLSLPSLRSPLPLPARPSWWGTAQAAASCWLAPGPGRGPFHPRTPDLHGRPRGPHPVKPLYPNLGASREQGPAAAGPPPERRPSLNHPGLVRTRPPPHLQGRPRASARPERQQGPKRVSGLDP